MPRRTSTFAPRPLAIAIAGAALAFALACRAEGGGGANPQAAARAATTPGRPGGEQTVTFGVFGKVHLLRPAIDPRHVILFVSGDGGWNLAAAAMARSLGGGDSLVLGIDIESYRKGAARTKASCTYAAADLEGLSKYVQLRLQLPAYRQPVLVGYSAGAALVYAALAQAPPNTFRGAVSLGFCPSLAFPKPLCKGSGLATTPGTEEEGESGSTFQPATHLSEPWVAIFGENDFVCAPKPAEDFVRHVVGGSLQIIPRTSHAFAQTAAWVPPFRTAINRMEQAAQAKRVRITAPAVSDLPLVEVPIARQQADNSRRFAVILSGDGGWAGLDRDVAGALATHGIPTVGWSSLDYFWQPRTPEGGAQDLERLLRHYLAAWKRDRILLIGYSLGADVLPFFANRLPPDLLEQVELVALLGPGRSTAFEFHVTDWLGGDAEDARPVLPEVRKLAGHPLLCLYGNEEDDSLCPLVQQPKAQTFAFSGAHHFGGSYEAVAERILGALQAAP